MYVYMYICMYVCMYVYMLYVCMYVCIYVCTYVHTVCMYIYVYMYYACLLPLSSIGTMHTNIMVFNLLELVGRMDEQPFLYLFFSRS